MQIKIESNKIRFYNSYFQKEILKSIGARFDRSNKVWWLSYDQDSVKAVNSAFNLNLQPPPAIITEKKPVQDVYIKYLYNHQKVSVNIGRQTNTMADFSEPGTGKTLVQIELLIERGVKYACPALIICPKSIMYEVWYRQLNQFFPDEMICLLDASSNDNRKKLNSKKNFYVINYEMVPIIYKDLDQIDWNTCILDESTRIKNHTAKRSKAIMKLRDKFKFRSIMTGTPAPNGLLDLFNQIRFLNPMLFGESYYAFRNRYMEQKPWDQWNWYAKNGSYVKIRERIAPIAVQHKKRDCIDLPPLVHEKRFTQLSKVQRGHYTDLKADFLTFISGRVIDTPFIITQLMKLRQICNGWIYSDEESLIIEQFCPKYDELLNVLEEIGDAQVIVFTHFRQTAQIVLSNLETDGYSVNCITGSDSEKLKKEKLSNFQWGNYQILVGNVGVLAHGLNLQFCSNVIFYELDFNLENFEQALQRIERIGQKNKMTAYYLLCSGTLETYILNKLKAKIDVNRQLDVEELKRSI